MLSAGVTAREAITALMAQHGCSMHDSTAALVGACERGFATVGAVVVRFDRYQPDAEFCHAGTALYQLRSA